MSHPSGCLGSLPRNRPVAWFPASARWHVFRFPVSSLRFPPPRAAARLEIWKQSIPISLLRFDIDLISFYFLTMTAVTVSSKYQIVIPKETRKKLGITSGTRLQAIHDEFGLRLVKDPSIDEIRGLLKGMKVEDMEIRDEQDRIFP
jgi:AbrB family looped-hinge helix DNA binding protein